MTIKSGIQGLIDRLKAQFPTNQDTGSKTATAVLPAPGAQTAVETKPHQVSNNGDASSHYKEVLEVVNALDSRVSTQGEETNRLVKKVDDHLDTSAESLVEQIDDKMARLGEQVARQVSPIGDLPRVAATAEKIVGQCTQLMDLVREQQQQSPTDTPDVQGVVDGAAERVLGQLQSHAAETKTQADGLKTVIDGAVKRLADGAAKESASMDGVRREVETATASMQEAAKRTEALTNGVRTVAEATTKLQHAVVQLKQSVETRDAHLTAMIERNRKSLTMFAYGFCIAGLLAIALAVVSFFV